ncbi:MAG: ferritin-like domain-containing protein, partial [Segetibacter sp.]
LRAALRIHSVEGRHASHLREMRNRNFDTPVKPWITLNMSFLGPRAAAVQASYAGEENVEQAGINIVGINGYNISVGAASEAFDEPLTKAQVLAIVSPFFA